LFFQLADSAANNLQQNLQDEKDFKIDFVIGKDYQVFQNSILAHFANKGINNEAGRTVVNFTLSEVKVDYSEPERKGQRSALGEFFYQTV